METKPRTYAADELKGGDVIVLPFRIPSAVCGQPIPKGTAVEVFDTYPRGGKTVLRVIGPGGTTVRSVTPSPFIRYALAN